MDSAPTKPWKWRCIIRWESFRNRNQPTHSAEEATFLILSLAGILAAAFMILQIRRQLGHAPAMAFGSIVQRVCVVHWDEIMSYCKMLAEKDAGRHLSWERRWKQLFVVWGFLREISWNTMLFQGAIRFEQRKIDPAKSSLDYEPRETLLFELIPDAKQLRMKLYKAQLSLFMRTVLGLRINQDVIIERLGVYKDLEHDMLGLAGMSDDPCFLSLLKVNLGLGEWRIFESGDTEPEPA